MSCNINDGGWDRLDTHEKKIQHKLSQVIRDSPVVT